MKICFNCSEIFNSTGWECPKCHTAPEVVDGHLSFEPNLAGGTSSFRTDRFAKLFEIEAGNFWFRSRNQLILWAMKKYFPTAKKFFEIGCGTGFVLSAVEKELPWLKSFGSDIHSEGIYYASKRLRKTQLFQMDARKIPFDREFDVIGAFDLLEHIKEDQAVLSQMHQAVHERGGIILTVPQHPFLWSYIDEIACHVCRYNAGKLKGKVEKVGFKIIETISFMSLLLPLVVVSRLNKKKTVKENIVRPDLKLPRAVDNVLGWILDLERYLIRSGIRFPIGSSLLLVARKV